eukprot:CAMPEP_0197362790 /NCGR_PEP_ID=MMETSP0893-20130614/64229_1 /TAXON_ID=44058 ORGANISM="Aureoumbra lagunensis, Strain CCMP1510" /NCGR_SAMPLE_ID=MMETSP0893 /ASSEMBLY_ACC=CAM_ASM_000539 /LENGTH=355 /DNA_ID=CAMNT_0042884669 /DNA_START=167 /DNA_END=1234 /DNA_ORIENTATION=+
MSYDEQGTWQLADYSLSLAQRKHILSSNPEAFTFLTTPHQRQPDDDQRVKNCWIEAAFGDGCGSYSGHSFGRERAAVLKAVEREILSKKQTILVTRDDCETPIQSARHLLNHPNLSAWYATNPHDWVQSDLIPTKKLHAVPIGVRGVAQWIPSLLKTSISNRSTLLMCCCMAHIEPTEALKRLNNPKTLAYHALRSGLLLNRSAYEQLYARQQMHVSHEALLRRVRRALIILALQANGFSDCTYSHLGIDQYAQRMLSAKFVVSPHGNGRACHREWEALLSGAIPLVDFDDSSSMAELLNGLPVIRVQDWQSITPTFLKNEYLRLSEAAAQHKLGLSKVYVPYWLDKFTQHYSPR